MDGERTAEAIARQELAAAGLAVLEIGGRGVVLVPLAQFVGQVEARLAGAARAQAALRDGLPRAAHRRRGRTR